MNFCAECNVCRKVCKKAAGRSILPRWKAINQRVERSKQHSKGRLGLKQKRSWRHFKTFIMLTIAILLTTRTLLKKRFPLFIGRVDAFIKRKVGVQLP